MIWMTSSMLSCAMSSPSSRWARSRALRRSYFVRRVMTSSWNVRYSSRMWRRERIFGWRWLSTSARLMMENVLCSCVWAKSLLSATWGLASRLSSMTMRIPLRSDSSRRSEISSSRLSLTCSAMFLMSIFLLTWYGSSLTMMRTRFCPCSSNSVRARMVTLPRPVA